MGNEKKINQSPRRDFFNRLMNQQKNNSTTKIKMLTADGKLVEVDQSVVQKASGGKKATNSEIYNWMDNPSKK
jgi:predicted SnoaL-like aldol condensation-catalyzing enzyme